MALEASQEMYRLRKLFTDLGHSHPATTGQTVLKIRPRFSFYK